LFWQYGGANRCAHIPDAGATDNEVWAFFDEIGAPTDWDDAEELWLEPYYWQVETQLGGAGTDTSYLDDLLVYDWKNVDDTPSIAIKPVFDPSAMQDVASWLASDAERVLIVYGERNPWTAGAVELASAHDSYEVIAPKANHGADIAMLAPEDKQAAHDALEAWTGVVPRTTGPTMTVQSPFALQRARRLGRLW